jgi:hypothetical protein
MLFGPLRRDERLPSGDGSVSLMAFLGIEGVRPGTIGVDVSEHGEAMARVSASSARAGRARRSGRPMRRRRIDFSDVPDASPTQFRAMRRVGQLPLGAAARRLIAIRIDPQILDAVRREAKRSA